VFFNGGDVKGFTDEYSTLLFEVLPLNGDVMP